MKNRLLTTAAAILAAAVVFSMKASASPIVSAQSAILTDAQTGRVLWQKDANSRSLIASTTKIMTGIIVAEECDLSEVICVPEQAAGVEGSSIYLKVGEAVSVEELLYGMMLHSGNDAAAALALHCGGSMENFVDKMNQKAQAVGLADTKFANPHGLDSADNYSTASDLAKLAQYAMKNPVLSKVVSTKSISFENRNFVNHNKLLWKYQGALGVKTGYTLAAGRILVSCVERDGRRLIAVTINDRNDWQDHCALFDYGFSTYEMRIVADITQLRVPVVGGASAYALAGLREPCRYPLRDEEAVEVEYRIPAFVYPPIIAGARAGDIVVLVDGEEILTLPIYWQCTVMEAA